MAETPKFMDFSTKPMEYSERFRNPYSVEKKMGLWVDRIGRRAGEKHDIPKSLRILGLYGAVYIEKGKGIFRSGSEEQRVSQGDVMLIFPDAPHRYGPDPEWDTRWIVWGGPEAKVLERTGYISRAEPVIRDYGEAVQRAHEALTGLIEQEDLGSLLLRKSLLLRMVHDLYAESRKAVSSFEHSEQITQAVLSIQEHITNPISIPELASNAHMSVTHFRRIFKLVTGRSPLHYITSLRISLAKQLLAEGKTIEETAEKLGYEDMFYFMRVFKRVAGIPPGKFVRSVSDTNP